MKVLFITTECAPYAKTGGLADVAAALPKALRDRGLDVRIFMPRYRGLETSGMKEVIGGLPVPISSKTVHGRVLEAATPDGVPIYFLDQPKYFDRRELYVEDGRDYPDNAERFTFFSRAAVEFARSKVFQPDLLHVHDWFGGLVPVYCRTLYAKDPVIGKAPVVLTIHNMAYQGIFWHYDMHLTNLSWDLFRFDRLEFYGKLNFLKGGLVYADKITTVSERYAREIRTAEFGYGLDTVLERRAEHLSGIINGVDYATWSPEIDQHLAEKYSAGDSAGKAACKRDLQALNNLPPSDRPLIGIISRLTEQKGFDLLEKIFPELMAMNVQFVLLGSGDAKYQEFFLRVAREHPLAVGVNITFSDELAHKIEAGSDIYLMPSRFEPCGLNQLYSLRYGAVPVVREVGGLADTVKEWNPETGHGTGFLFRNYDPQEFLSAIRRAVALYDDRKSWAKLMANGMKEDWSWPRSADAYRALYESLCPRK